MSEVVLATKYAAKNYPISLKNLAKRYQRANSGEAVHYSELGFGGISDQQAKDSLRFFADIELLENPKGANYIPSEALIEWQLKMGETANQGKAKVREQLLDCYNVFSELSFVLEQGEEELDTLAEQVGGLVGIDEDELASMKKTIEVFAECSFFEISDEEVVSLPDELEKNSTDAIEKDKNQPGAEKPSGTTLTHYSNQQDSATKPEAEVQTTSPEVVQTTDSDQKQDSQSAEVDIQTDMTIDLDISIDATKMEAEDLRAKLEIIEETVGHDGD